MTPNILILIVLGQHISTRRLFNQCRILTELIILWWLGIIDLISVIIGIGYTEFNEGLDNSLTFVTYSVGKVIRGVKVGGRFKTSALHFSILGSMRCTDYGRMDYMVTRLWESFTSGIVSTWRERTRHLPLPPDSTNSVTETL